MRVLVCNMSNDLQSWNARGKTRPRPRLRLETQTVPTVNVFIPYCGEGLALLLDTVRSACALNYPKDRFRVIVLDDSHSSEIARAVDMLGDYHPSIHYTTRGVEVKKYSKALNLNHGLRFAKSLDENSEGSEILASLDVDMIPEPDWLQSLIPHFLQDDRVGVAFIPQQFYDNQLHGSLGQILSPALFWKVQAVQRDALGTTLGSGSGYVARRKAIEQIGGWPTDVAVEDWTASVKLRLAGWKTIFIDEPLQWGISPDSFAGHIEQRRRWKSGVFDIADALPQITKRLSKRRRRIAMFLIEVSAALPVFVLSMCLMGMPLLLLSGKALVLSPDSDSLIFLAQLAMIHMVVQSLHGWLMSRITGSSIYIYHGLSEMWLNIYLYFTLLHHWLPRLSKACFGELPALTPPGDQASRSLEHGVPYRNSMLSRIKIVLWDCGALLHLLILVSCVVGGIVSFGLPLLCLPRNEYSGTTWVMRSLAHGGWPTGLLLWTSVISNAWVPIGYAISSPSTSSREKLLVKDEKTQAARPTQAAKDSCYPRVTEWQLALVSAYLIVLILGYYQL